ncbi:type B DNA-directed DNA polymerase [Haladaptatus sp. T7]|uniref:type B DNA-directed DNA polymerase n=1 Tax=Haladaptatus sp. T7 TaxID=2029368 RepID=UPI0021A25949|nr:type B DNA-directed DNA polymerase [Haladaptatus sp. T7]GKZ16055.1 DNA polymerase I [Haladaptatus sp. T7]
MVYKIDSVDGDVLTWSVTESGVECEVDESYTPTIYVSVHGDVDFSTARAALHDHPAVVRVAIVDERVSFRHDHEQVLRVDVVDLKAVNSVARMVSKWGSPGEYRCYNVDFSREFRYCLEEGVDPLPTHELSQMQLAVSETELASEQVTEVTIDDETVTGSGEDILTALSDRVESVDPDVLFLNTSDLIPVLFQQAERLDVEFQLGRRPGWQQLAGESTYESYGQVGHSPARYNLPGRVIIDGSNTFMWNQTNLDGCLYLVEQSGKPLQELAWSSIGNILTGIQIQEARELDVLVPWRSWRHEKFKTMRQLHDADRGGFTFSPDVGLHEDVHELDFSSLYPNIIVTRNVSPEKIRCECHAEREDVPGIGYSICDERGYLPDVLEPLIEDRDAIKAEIRATEDEERREELEGQSSAIKWILVSCFGYQGFSNAKFGRIECHEAINAYAREILLETKAVLEEHGWRIVHGIVDSVWVTPIDGEEQTSLSALVSKISEEVEIRLEHEAHYDWISFVPLRDSDAGALTKYFGKVAGEDEYKYRGIECRQRSTPSYIDAAQKALIRAVDAYRDPEAVCEELRSWVDRLERGAIDPNALVITNRVSKKKEDYTQSTRSVAALERAADLGLGRAPGQSVSYVVVDDAKQSRERVLLASEELNEYDVGFYRDLLVRAAASVLSPLGWRESDIEEELGQYTESSLQSFV